MTLKTRIDAVRARVADRLYRSWPWLAYFVAPSPELIPSPEEDYWSPMPDGTKIESVTQVDHDGGRVRVSTMQIIKTPDGEVFPGRIDIEEGTEH
jgi:hypothetical protein